MMTGIFCISADFFYAKSYDDDMKWTGSLDKKLFHLLSHGNHGNNIVGRKTYDVMPNIWGRKLFSVSRNAMHGESIEYYMTRYDCLNLLGGQSLIKESIIKGYLDTLFLNTIEQVTLGSGLPFTLFDEGVIDREKHMVDEIQFDGIKVEVFRF